MTKKQLNYAAKLYTLSGTYHGMGRAGGLSQIIDGERNSLEVQAEQANLIDHTAEMCLQKLHRLGHGAELATISDCIEAAKIKYPSKSILQR